MQRRFRLAVTVAQRFPINEYGFAFATFLLVVNPSNDRHNVVKYGFFDEAVLAVKVDCLRVMLVE